MDAYQRIGVVVAVEVHALLEKYGRPTKMDVYPGFKVHEFDRETFTLFAVDCGAGEIASAAATQYLISACNVDVIINFGVVGGLTPEMSTAELCVVRDVVHYDFDSTGWLNLARGQYPGFVSRMLPTNGEHGLLEKALEIAPSLKTVVCASADKFVNTMEEKQALHDEYGADICDMESAGIVLTCHRNNVPCLLIKAVSDGLTGGGKEFLQEMERVSRICFDIVDEILRS